MSAHGACGPSVPVTPAVCTARRGTALGDAGCVAPSVILFSLTLSATTDLHGLTHVQVDSSPKTRVIGITPGISVATIPTEQSRPKGVAELGMARVVSHFNVGHTHSPRGRFRSDHFNRTARVWICV
jgi:hypothetical protein